MNSANKCINCSEDKSLSKHNVVTHFSFMSVFNLRGCAVGLTELPEQDQDISKALIQNMKDRNLQNIPKNSVEFFQKVYDFYKIPSSQVLTEHDIAMAFVNITGKSIIICGDDF